MNTGFYSALAGLVARSQGFDVVANNLANVSSPGYRAQRGFFHTLELEQADSPYEFNNGFAAQFGVLGGAFLDERPGHLEETGNPFDVALEGPGYFAIQTSRGVRYTRNGQFHANSGNQLVNADGDTVLGDQGAIELPRGPISISSSGMISAQGAIAGQLKVVEFPAGVRLRPEGNTNFAPDSPAAEDSYIPAGETRLRQGAIEASNMTPIEGAVALMTLQRQTEMLQRTLMMFHAEFNRIAVEDLPKTV